jgi:hypothetical protein
MRGEERGRRELTVGGGHSRPVQSASESRANRESSAIRTRSDSDPDAIGVSFDQASGRTVDMMKTIARPLIDMIVATAP